jgi:hypothetical protein
MGEKDVSKLSKRDLFILGVALYWGVIKKETTKLVSQIVIR